MTTTRVGRTRWAIGSLIGIGIIVNFADRTALSVTAKQIADEYGLSMGQLGIVLSAFTWSYCLMQLPAGVLADMIGVKWLNRVGTVLWTVASALTAIASGLGLIMIARIILGIGEGPAMVGAAKATSSWFPLQERGRATALFEAATKLSNVLALPTLAAVTSLWGWRAAFVFSAVLSLLFAIAWWVLYREPGEHPRLSAAELTYIRQGGAQPSRSAAVGRRVSARTALRSRKVWALVLGFACYGYVINLLVAWVPAYLETRYHVSPLRSGLYATIPWIAATIADFAIGGWLVDRLIRSGRDPSAVRRVTLGAGLLLGLAVALINVSDDPMAAVVWMTVAITGLSVAAPVAWSLPGIVAPAGTVGLVSGLMNFFNTAVSLVAVVLTGFVVDLTGTFSGAFLLASAVLLIGFVMYFPVLGRIEQVRFQVRPEGDSALFTDEPNRQTGVPTQAEMVGRTEDR
ncbi:putative transporter YybO [Longimycelium tulufanense]|uniref:Putative transporter YybO n=1 Tax=Longimycelium tulufanense TaxID=907463 RepID=A0A8J3FXF2_9PSEU|nr:MFS transporter [Longimycelium tulufanense]GGM79228.1 putative transporter YybO [Longimycelium tulufanense]